MAQMAKWGIDPQTPCPPKMRIAASGKGRTMASFGNVNVTVSASAAQAEMERLIREHTARAIAEIDISKWLGWGEGVPVLNCIICGEKTEGRITFVTNSGGKNGSPKAMHKDCMAGTLDDAPTEKFEEIVQRLEQGEALFGEDDE